MTTHDSSSSVDPKALREQLALHDPADTRSSGFLRFILRLSEALDVDLPPQEHQQLATLDGCYAFIASQRRASSALSSAFASRAP